MIWQNWVMGNISIQYIILYIFLHVCNISYFKKKRKEIMKKMSLSFYIPETIR